MPGLPGCTAAEGLKGNMRAAAPAGFRILTVSRNTCQNHFRSRVSRARLPARHLRFFMNEYLFDGHSEKVGYSEGEAERWIILLVLDRDDAVPGDTQLLCKLLLCQVVDCPEDPELVLPGPDPRRDRANQKPAAARMTASVTRTAAMAYTAWS